MASIKRVISSPEYREVKVKFLVRRSSGKNAEPLFQSVEVPQVLGQLPQAIQHIKHLKHQVPEAPPRHQCQPAPGQVQLQDLPLLTSPLSEARVSALPGPYILPRLIQK